MKERSLLPIEAHPSLTLEALLQEAHRFAVQESQHHDLTLFGVTDGKAVGTYLEHKFRRYLQERYEFVAGNSAAGIDFPGLLVDFKATSVRQPQSSCPFKSARQKVYGLGYSLLVFAYEKIDEPTQSTGNLLIRHVVFVDKEHTADFQTTIGLQHILANHGNEDDIVAFLIERMLPLDDIQAVALAQEILLNPPEVGHLTISNALQWRLQYSRAIEKAGTVEGVIRVK